MSPNPLEVAEVSAPPVVVHTPTGRDGVLVAELLESHGYYVHRTRLLAELLGRLDPTLGAVVLAEEALDAATALGLREALEAQPSWSDLPIVILTVPSRGPRPPHVGLAEFRETANITLLERPVQPETLLTAVRAAVRARVRQYQVRNYLDERARTEEQVRRRQRLEAVGKLAGGVAHEVNNMMTVVLGFSDIAMRRLDPDHPSAADIQEVIKAGERAARITQQLLAFTRQQPNQPALLSLPAVVRDLSKLLQQSLGAEYTLYVDIPADVPAIRADRTQLDQVLINLVLNARDATAPGGSVSIAVEAVELDEDYIGRHDMVAMRSGPYVMLAVSDTGEGMDPETVDRAFEPFYTTKPVGQGTGLGLSTVYGIVKQAGGYVWLYSELGRGTTVKIYLPAVTGAERVTGAPQLPKVRGDERILVVEDEEMVRMMARRALEEYGYEVVEAADGRTAIDLLSTTSRPVDLVLSDIVMPGLSGHELAAAIAETAPDACILYMSGYTGSDVIRKQLIDPSAPFIQKPFRPDDLALKVRRLLDARIESPQHSCADIAAKP
ncbi:MAG TPA: ATP-binding protein [Gemmatimonadales bacterium]|nr:ATP-binding protein [Gemmatimonadales bacterium]